MRKHFTTRGLLRIALNAALALLCLMGLSGAAWADEWHQGAHVQFGQEIVVPEGTVTYGDAVAIFNDIEVLGEIRGDAVAIGGKVRVNGTVTGDVISVGGQVDLGEKAQVHGVVTVVGAGLNRAAGAQVRGAINNIRIGDLSHPRIILPNWRWFGLPNPVGYLLYLLGLYALSLVTITLLPDHTANVANHIEKEWSRSALIGLLALLLIVPVSLLCILTLIGILAVPLLWLVFFLAKMLGYVAMVSFLGAKVGRQITDNNVAQIAIGVLLLGLVRYVPLLGALVSLAVTILSLGAVLDTKFGANTPWLPPRNA